MLWPIIQSMAGAWPARAGMEAKCMPGHCLDFAHPHPVPLPQGACGIWAFDGPRLESLDLRFIEAARMTGQVAFGRVKLWGRVMCFEQGWRGQFARPLSLYRMWPTDQDEGMARLAADYGIVIEEPPVGLVARIDYVRRANQEVREVSGRVVYLTPSGLMSAVLASNTAGPTRRSRWDVAFFWALNIVGSMNIGLGVASVLRHNPWGTSAVSLVVGGACLAIGPWFYRWAKEA